LAVDSFRTDGLSQPASTHKAQNRDGGEKYHASEGM
jgi:hypothetical protein